MKNEVHMNINNSEMDVDINNNNMLDNKTQLKCELPFDNKYAVQQQCVCNHPHKVLECGKCHQYFYGRVSEVCRIHPMDNFLMDFHYCPFCYAPSMDISITDMTLEELRNIENGILPNAEMEDLD